LWWIGAGERAAGDGLETMWWKLIGLGMIEAALIALLFLPIKTHAVVVEMPPPGAARHTVETLDAYVLPALAVGAYAVAVAILVLPIWMGYLVVRKARPLK